MAKNKYIENLRKHAKRYAKTAKKDSRWDSKRGIKVYHLYDGDSKKEESWWDDVAFIEGSQQVTVWYIHPRLKYNDMCGALAHDLVKDDKPERGDEWLNESTPNYRYLGKNKKRKKVVSYTMAPLSDARSAWFEEWNRVEEDILRNGNVVARPSMRVKQYSYCRGVEICIPMEVLNPDHLKELVDIVRRCLKDPTLFDKLYGDYAYTKDDWNREIPVKEETNE